MVYKVNAQTIRNILKSANYESHSKKSALPLNNKRKKERLAFAKKYKDWTVADWRRVVFSDETKVNRLGSDGKQWTWIQKGASLRDHNVNKTYKNGGGSLFLWSCITSEGPGYITRIDGGLDSKLYCQILDEDLRATLDYYNMNIKGIIFQQDNDPKHTSKLTKEWLNKTEIEVIDWPSYSPDINPIENLWFFLKSQLCNYETSPSGMIELWDRVKDVWYNKVAKELCLKLIDSMPKPIESVIKAKGGQIPY